MVRGTVIKYAPGLYEYLLRPVRRTRRRGSPHVRGQLLQRMIRGECHPAVRGRRVHGLDRVGHHRLRRARKHGVVLGPGGGEVHGDVLGLAGGGVDTLRITGVGGGRDAGANVGLTQVALQRGGGGVVIGG